ncbi:MAG: LegC family aminotransferase [Tannerella forsythia]|jgi:putative aminotransferase|uniref:GDP-perosamine synthase n=1 Tax=Tannerella forsythia (strain ATCC 43037 / JCM 10827 / CCUG 21028 A / KCTC 5666 / FDC 338) TaxID=203275 RepID=G8UHQ6_TANFA|nr:LegC family aminotransferase [Tannerella forsythia]AEW19965.1 DegT/DnrJ/EryC1/StrS aminotransferase family protein [Tannerella forsythia 92A2]PDP72153.1 aminotransferase DegT [Tannerella forsythia]SCQ19651.1 Putative pyridoxal phosphate-dependent aminotransferase EpsN [Tannerella forsythia]
MESSYKKITDFIHDLYGAPEVPLHAPCFIGNEKKYLAECVDTTFVSSVGQFVDRFEEKMAQYTGAARAVTCVNGTNALHLALLLVGVARGDEVLTQALTFIATCNAIRYIDAHPVFLDVDQSTMGLSPDAMRDWLFRNAEMKDSQCFNKNTQRRIKACVPMHTFGHPARIDEIAAVCEEYHIELVEDAAESLGSLYKGQHTGLFGRVGVISFNGNKTITTGGGGMLLLNNEELGAQAKHLTTQAKVPHRWEFIHDRVGYNYRMPNINAALGCAQLEHLEEFVLNKRETAEKYHAFFATIDDMDYFLEPENCRSNYWLNTILLKDRQAQQDFLQYTNAHGIMTRPAWQLMNRLEMFKGCETDGLKHTQWLEERIVNIPSSVNLKK